MVKTTTLSALTRSSMSVASHWPMRDTISSAPAALALTPSTLIGAASDSETVTARTRAEPTMAPTRWNFMVSLLKLTRAALFSRAVLRQPRHKYARARAED